MPKGNLPARFRTIVLYLLVCDSNAAHVPRVPLSSREDRILALATSLYRPHGSVLHDALALHEAFWSQTPVSGVARARFTYEIQAWLESQAKDCAR